MWQITWTPNLQLEYLFNCVFELLLVITVEIGILEKNSWKIYCCFIMHRETKYRLLKVCLKDLWINVIVYCLFSGVTYINMMKKYSIGVGKEEEKDKFNTTRYVLQNKLIYLPPTPLSYLIKWLCYLVFHNLRYLIVEYI